VLGGIGGGIQGALGALMQQQQLGREDEQRQVQRGQAFAQLAAQLAGNPRAAEILPQLAPLFGVDADTNTLASVLQRGPEDVVPGMHEDIAGATSLAGLPGRQQLQQQAVGQGLNPLDVFGPPTPGPSRAHPLLEGVFQASDLQRGNIEAEDARQLELAGRTTGVETSARLGAEEKAADLFGENRRQRATADEVAKQQGLADAGFGQTVAESHAQSLERIRLAADLNQGQGTQTHRISGPGGENLLAIINPPPDLELLPEAVRVSPNLITLPAAQATSVFEQLFGGGGVSPQTAPQPALQGAPQGGPSQEEDLFTQQAIQQLLQDPEIQGFLQGKTPQEQQRFISDLLRFQAEINAQP